MIRNLIAIGAMALLSLTAARAGAADAPDTANVQLIKSFLADIRAAAASHDPSNIRAVAERYMDENYVQHSGFYAPGREGFIASMTSTAVAPPTKNNSAANATSAVAPKGTMTIPKDLYFFDNGEYVVWVSESMQQQGKLDFNMIRIVNGKMKEHWDSR